jgi:hypothetical protein
VLLLALDVGLVYAVGLSAALPGRLSHGCARSFCPARGAVMIRRMNRHAPAIRLSSWLLCALLIACVSSPPPHSAEDPLEEVFSSFEEGCADTSTFEPDGVQLTRFELLGPIVPYYSRKR